MNPRQTIYEAAFEAFLSCSPVCLTSPSTKARRSGRRWRFRSRVLTSSSSPPGQNVVASRCERPAIPVRRRASSVLEETGPRATNLRSLAAWQDSFGADFCPMLVFAYHLVAGRARRCRPDQLFEFRGDHTYGFLGVRLADYVPHARPLSDSWDTVAMPTRSISAAPARPLDDWFRRLTTGRGKCGDRIGTSCPPT